MPLFGNLTADFVGNDRAVGCRCHGWRPPCLDALPDLTVIQVCGQNPAYDFFPSQHQIFYRGRGPGVMWYDPVFKVFTINGEEVSRPIAAFRNVGLVS